MRSQPLLTAGNVFAYAMSVYLYASSFRRGAGKRGKLLAAGGDTSSVVYDFFIGRELNPRCVLYCMVAAITRLASRVRRAASAAST